MTEKQKARKCEDITSSSIHATHDNKKQRLDKVVYRSWKSTDACLHQYVCAHVYIGAFKVTSNTTKILYDQVACWKCY